MMARLRQMHVFLRTQRLVLRQLTESDADNLARLNSDPEVTRYLPGGAATTPDEVRDKIIPYQLDCYERFGGLGLWAADDPESGEFLGWFHIRPRRSDGVIDLGYRLRRQIWGRGWPRRGRRR
jgi:RimJ/RimL family protein N-acetyltransferase